MNAKRSVGFALVSGGRGGGQRVALAVGQRLVERGWSLSVLSPSSGESAEAFRRLGADVIITGPLRSFDLLRMNRLRRLIARKRIAVVYTHTVPTHEIVVGLAARWAGSRLIVHRHSVGHFSTTRATRLYQVAMWRYLMSRADDVISVSDEVRAQLGARSKRSHLVPNGVPIPEGELTFRRGDDLTVGSIGRMDPNKRFEDLINAAAAIRNEAPAVRFVIVGGGEGGLYERECRALIEDLSLSDIFSFFGDERDARHVIDEMDVVVLPSVLEGHPLVLLEAMARGKAVVVSDIPGHRATIRDRVDGWVVPPREPGAIARAVVELVRSPQLRQELGRAAAVRARELFSEERMVDDLVRVVEAH